MTAVTRERVRDTVIIELQEKGGEIGWGEAVANTYPWYSCETVQTEWHIIRDFIAPELIGKEISPETFEVIVKRIRGHRMAKAGVEFGLWDLKGKLSGRSIKDLIGGVRNKVEVGLSVGVIGNADLLIQRIGKGIGEGYKRIKLKIKPGWDIEPVKIVRKEFGDIPLQVDANASYTLDYIEVFRTLDTFNLLMIEQPLHHEDLLMHSKLQSTVKTPICLDESIKSLMDVKAAYELRSCKVINLKPARVGGIKESLRIHDFCMSKGIPIWIGGMLETGIGRAYAVALASLPNVKYPNDISPSNRFWEEDIVEPPWLLNNDGTISVPKSPGIGIEVNERTFKRYEVNLLAISG